MYFGTLEEVSFLFLSLWTETLTTLQTFILCFQEKLQNHFICRDKSTTSEESKDHDFSSKGVDGSRESDFTCVDPPITQSKHQLDGESLEHPKGKCLRSAPIVTKLSFPKWVKVPLFFYYDYLLLSYRNDEFKKKLTHVIDGVLRDIPCYEDAVVDVFYGHRNRDGDVATNKYTLL